ncbi:MAG: DNA topoisomerase I subunit omega, partial [Shewanellaceae bacterium]|nr:DNA topoisomerase I subunit omega [Shewanellaceae bacterium]
PKEDPIPLPELPCAQSDAYFMLRDGAAGIFLAAHTFPKSRETRAPLVEEIVRFKDKIWPKYQYLVGAPTVDNEGNKTVVKFSRKTKEQYVASEIDRKATGWQAYYVDGAWQVAAKSKKAAAKKTTTGKGSKAKSSASQSKAKQAAKAKK